MLLPVFLLLALAWADVRFHAQEPAHIAVAERLGLQRTSSPGVWSGPAARAAEARDAGMAVHAEAPRGELDGIYAAYRGNDAYERELRALASHTGGQVWRIGTSGDGRGIWGARLGPAQPNLPRVLFAAGIHGDEIVGPELVVDWAWHAIRDDATDVLSRHSVWLLPLINPDGHARRQRHNAAGVDLNRNFPDRLLGEDAADWPGHEESAPRQPETQAVMSWLADAVRPHAVAVLHGGAVVCSYPMDGAEGRGHHHYAASPDDDLFREVCGAWARNNPSMARSRMFRGGVTNGNSWYPLFGGLQDWAYAGGAVSVTTEVSAHKTPAHDLVRGRYLPENLGSMTAFAHAAAQGVRGRIMDARTGQPIAGAVHVGAGPEDGFVARAAADGYFMRPLPVGKARLTVVSTGYTSVHLEVDVAAGHTYVREFRLEPY